MTQDEKNEVDAVGNAMGAEIRNLRTKLEECLEAFEAVSAAPTARTFLKKRGTPATTRRANACGQLAKTMAMEISKYLRRAPMTETERVTQLSREIMKMLSTTLDTADALTCLSYTVFAVARTAYPQRNNEELAVLNDKAFRTLIGEMEDIEHPHLQ